MPVDLLQTGAGGHVAWHAADNGGYQVESVEGVAAAAVGVLASMITGAATEVGSSTAQTVSEMVRRRLGGFDEGRAALADVDASPTDSASIEGLRSALQAAMDSDAEFAGRLAQALGKAGPESATSTSYTHSIVIGGARLRGSNISIGPLTITNTRTARLSLASAALAVLIVLAMAVYGTIRLVVPEDTVGTPRGTAKSASSSPRESGPSGSADSASGAAGASVPLTAAQIRKIPPNDEKSLPLGWPPSLGQPLFDYCGTASSCLPRQFYGQWRYFNATGVYERLSLVMSTFDTSKGASADFRKTLPKSGSCDFLDLPLQDVGANSWTACTKAEGDYTEWAMVHVGTVVFSVDMSLSSPIPDGALEAFTRAVAERARQAQEGKTPTAVVDW
ncbi:hypothetical protein [Streptomyces sp. NPDC055287]